MAGTIAAVLLVSQKETHLTPDLKFPKYEKEEMCLNYTYYILPSALVGPVRLVSRTDTGHVTVHSGVRHLYHVGTVGPIPSAP